MLGQYLARLNLEINGALYQQWIVIQHLLKFAINELVLYVVAAVMEAAGSDIA